MVTSQKAYKLARSYSMGMGEVLPDIYFDVKPGKEFRDCFYYDFIIVDKFGNIPNEPPMIGGAPGVIVDKLTGLVKPVSFGELSKLK